MIYDPSRRVPEAIGLSVAEDITGTWGHYHLVVADKPHEALCGARTTGTCLDLEWGGDAGKAWKAGSRETFCVKCDWVQAVESDYSTAAVLDIAAIRVVNALFEGMEYGDDR